MTSLVFCHLNPCFSFICFVSVFDFLFFSNWIGLFHRCASVCWAIFHLLRKWNVHVRISHFSLSFPPVLFCLPLKSIPVSFCMFLEWKWAFVIRCWLMCDLQLLTTNTFLATKVAIILTDNIVLLLEIHTVFLSTGAFRSAKLWFIVCCCQYVKYEAQLTVSV